MFLSFFLSSIKLPHFSKQQQQQNYVSVSISTDYSTYIIKLVYIFVQTLLQLYSQITS